MKAFPENGKLTVRGGRLPESSVHQTFTVKYPVSLIARQVVASERETLPANVRTNPASLSPIALLTFSWLHRRYANIR